MIFTTVQILRNGVPVAGLTNLQGVQIDEMQADPRMFDAGASPYDVFNIFIPYAPAGGGTTTYVPRLFGGTLILSSGAAPTILRNDQVEDIGPTASGYYRISNRPEYFIDGHVEIIASQAVGT